MYYDELLNKLRDIGYEAEMIDDILQVTTECNETNTLPDEVEELIQSYGFVSVVLIDIRPYLVYDGVLIRRYVRMPK